MKKKCLFPIILIIFALGCNTQTSNNFGDEVTAEQIVEMINTQQNVLLVDKTIKGNLDFTKTNNKYARTQNVIIADIESSITFVRCEFEDSITAFTSDKETKKGYLTIFEKNLTFSECVFREEVNLRQVEIKGLANFSKSTFEKTASFEGAVFRHHKNFFNNSTFNGEAKFTHSSFYGQVTFMNAVFNLRRLP